MKEEDIAEIREFLNQLSDSIIDIDCFLEDELYDKLPSVLEDIAEVAQAMVDKFCIKEQTSERIVGRILYGSNLGIVGSYYREVFTGNKMGKKKGKKRKDKKKQAQPKVQKGKGK